MSCGRKVGPYDCCSIVLGDCLLAATSLPRDGSALITDPPYGINLDTNYATAQRGCRRDWPRIEGDDKPFDPTPWLDFPRVVLFGANHYANRLPASPGWVVWYKRLNNERNDQADCELAWTNRNCPARCFHHEWNGFRRASEQHLTRLHPTMKPVALMDFIICEYASHLDTIIDPYAGSGTTLVAAKTRGKHYLGFELVEEYVRTTEMRLKEVDNAPRLFEVPKAEQVAMF